MSPKLRNSAIKVRAEQGQVHVSGILPQFVSETDVIPLIEGVPGVTKVVTDLIIPNEYHGYHV